MTLSPFTNVRIHVCVLRAAEREQNERMRDSAAALRASMVETHEADRIAWQTREAILMQVWLLALCLCILALTFAICFPALCLSLSVSQSIHEFLHILVAPTPLATANCGCAGQRGRVDCARAANRGGRRAQRSRGGRFARRTERSAPRGRHRGGADA
jgi:hypothetical protein